MRYAPPLIRHSLAATLLLGGIFFTAPWPSLQGVFHAFLVLGLAPQASNLLLAALWAAAGGWILEGTLRLYPVVGGTPWADITLVVLAATLARRWPPDRLWIRWAQLAALTALHALAVHGAVRLACGPHPWGTGWAWALASVPLWGTLIHHFQKRPSWR
ncbi:MAG: hypothetical protein HY823_08705 [Acidobacteria bacterium]|nr:hypothetical protein [Acidobacteriota bacterium]